MTAIREYVQGLTDDEKVAIIDSFEEFETNGAIGDEPVRLHARALLTRLGASEATVVVWMQHLAFECYRYFARQYLVR